MAIDFIVDPPDGKIFGDQTQLKQVVLNIGNNAVQAVEDIENPKVVIKVSQVLIKSNTVKKLEPGTYLKIEVIDNGHGIKKEIIERVFEPFFTTKEVGKGTGLGLSVVHGIVERHNGQIKIDSSLGQSTHISVYLPLFPNSTAGEHKEYTGDEKVYLIARESEIAAQYSMALEHIQHDTQAFLSANDFIQKFKIDLNTDSEDTFPLVIIDENSGDQSPEEIIRRIRQLSKSVPILVLVSDSGRFNPIPFNLRVAEIQKSKDIISQKNNDMTLILLTRELKYGMNMAMKALSS